MSFAVSFFSGVLFAIGLVISGMTDPNIVIGFLDVFGDWNLQLLFVMGGAVAVNIVSFRLILKRKNPLWSSDFSLPTKKDLDSRLIVGSALFGVGWGIMGICPGPGLVNLVTLNPLLVGFVLAMFAGMLAHKFLIK